MGSVIGLWLRCANKNYKTVRVWWRIARGDIVFYDDASDLYRKDCQALRVKIRELEQEVSRLQKMCASVSAGSSFDATRGEVARANQ